MAIATRPIEIHTPNFGGFLFLVAIHRRQKELLLALVLHLVAVASHKFLDASSSVDQLLLACVKRMAVSGNIDCNDGILDAVYDFRLVRLGSANPRPFVFTVNEQNWIYLGVNAFFHNFLTRT